MVAQSKLIVLKKTSVGLLFNSLIGCLFSINPIGLNLRLNLFFVKLICFIVVL